MPVKLNVRMANSIDHDQTAPLIRIYIVCIEACVPKFRIILVKG